VKKVSSRENLVGRELCRFTYLVERGKIRELVLAIGDDNPLYTDPEYARARGYRDIIAPPTFGTCIDLWGGMDFTTLCSKLQLNPVKVLHGEQEYRYFKEICPGDRIEAVCRLSRIIDKGKMYLFILETEYFNQEGELVLSSRHTIIERK
jgi:acyl dehydratase